MKTHGVCWKVKKYKENCGFNVMRMTKIKITPQYGTRVAVVPVPADGSLWKNATRDQLALLLVLMAEGECTPQMLCEKSGVSEKNLESALKYWMDADILSVEGIAAGKGETYRATVTRRPDRAAELPHYNTDEAAKYLESHPAASNLIDCCQQELGKIFNTSEAEIVIGLLDYLSLDPEYILLLFAHCAKWGMKSLRYIEKMAITLHDAGIVTYDQLDLHLKKADRVSRVEYALRDLFGIGKRALIKRERDAFFRWVAEWEMPLDVITRAYEITVGSTKEPSVPYTNAILEKWHAKGLTTLEAVEEEEAQRNPASGKGGMGNFDTDDFFEAALRRSYDTPKEEVGNGIQS